MIGKEKGDGVQIAKQESIRVPQPKFRVSFMTVFEGRMAPWE